MTAKEHSDRVRFDPNTVKQKFPNSGYRLIYPTTSQHSDMYLKISKRANEMWKENTGTVP